MATGFFKYRKQVCPVPLSGPKAGKLIMEGVSEKPDSGSGFVTNS
jgi:hypothetical protein